MMTYDQLYLLLVIAAFLSFSAALGTVSWLNRK
jgi:hypothetical protein